MSLSQANFSFMRTCFKNSERMANFKSQLKFISQCQGLGVFPKTIGNLHLPQFYQQPSFTGRASRLKKAILKDMVRYLRCCYFTCRRKTKRLNDQIRQTFDNARADSIINICKAVYFHAFNKRETHFREKLKTLLPPPSSDLPPDVRPELSRDELVTDMTNALSEDELSLLAKGPNFAIKAKLDERTKLDIQTQLCRLAYQIRWHHKRKALATHQPDDNSTRNLPKFPESTFTCVPPTADDETELALRGVTLEISRLFNSIGPNTICSNLSNNECRTLRDLRNKPLVYLPSDKGSEFCVITETQYIKAGEEHLCDDAIYVRAKIAASTIETRVNSTWKNVCREADLPLAIQRSYTTRNSKLPEFYHLIKTHKAGPDVKIRPIVACRGGPTAKLAWLMSVILKPLLATFPAHLESSYALMDAINRVPNDVLRSHNYPISLDVNALYTSVPANEAIQAVVEQLSNQRGVTPPLRTQHITAILEVILSNTYFTFNNHTYKQVSGLPMGSSISSLLAITFMNRLENGPLTTCRVALYRRYVDDCCILTTGKEEAEKILNIMNQQHSSIQFDLELPSEDGVLSLLDFSIKVASDGSVSFNFFQKKARKPLFVNYNSALPTSTKNAIIRNELTRISNRSSTPSDRDININRFKSVLKLNDYPTTFVNRVTNSRSNRKCRPEHHNDFFYLRLPFLSDHINTKVTRIFKKYNLPVRVYHRSRKLRFLLKRHQNKECTLNNCSMVSSGLCNTTYCVYMLQCDKCSATYIGSTIRPLHIRIREHHSSPRSSVYSHKLSCGASFKVQVLGRERDCTSLRIREALLIKNRNPTINSRQEREEFAGLLS